MIKTYIFDLGNVIVRFDHTRIITRIAEFCPLSSSEIEEFVFSTDVIRQYEIGKTSSLEFYAHIKQK